MKLIGFRSKSKVSVKEPTLRSGNHEQPSYQCLKAAIGQVCLRKGCIPMGESFSAQAADPYRGWLMRLEIVQSSLVSYAFG